MTTQDYLQYLLYIAIGLTIGSVSGMLGIGGGVLIVPALMWMCGLDAKKAAGTSLAILIPPIGLPAAWRYYQEGAVDLPAALWIAGAFTIGALVGQSLIDYIREPEAWFRLAFGLIMIFVAIRFILASDSEAAAAAGGITALALAWLGYLGLKWLGRRHLPPPKLGELIQKQHEEQQSGPEYHI